MISLPVKAPKKPKIETLSYRDWLKGTVTARDDGRTPKDGLRASNNVRLTQDGTLAPRPSLRKYGVQPVGVIKGDVFEFVQTTTTGKVNWLGCLQTVAGITKFYITKDTDTWTVCEGKTFDNNAMAEYLEVDDKVLIMNGKDTLAYFDTETIGSTHEVVPFNAIADPTAPTLTANTGLTGTDFNIYYRITANSSVGSTAASPVLTVPVSLQRETWVKGTHSIKIGWAAVTGAKSYSVWMSTVDPAAGGTATLLVSGLSSLTFTDDGSMNPDVSRAAPITNNTAGPIAHRGTVINGQVFLIHATEPHIILAGGNLAGTQLDFSDFGGGGEIPIGRGTKEFPVSVKLVQSGQGAKITVFCRGTNGYGKRYIIKPDTITSGDTVIAIYGVEEDNGEDGTESPQGVVMYRDDAYYPSRDGFKKTGVQPQLQTMMKTRTISETIEKDVQNLSAKYIHKCVGLVNQGVIYWAVANGSVENNEIWLYDANREGAWMKPWAIAASAMTLYNDNVEGETHHLILSNNVLYELTEDITTMDDTIPFRTNITSGHLKFSENGQDWAKVLDVTFVVGRPQGEIVITVSGRGKSGAIAGFADRNYTALNTVAGWGEAAWGGDPDELFGWSDFSDIPTVAAEASRDIPIKINKLCKWLTWELNTSKPGVNYQLQDVIVRFVRVGYIKSSS